MGFLDQHPALKKAIANQYQAILVAGAIGFSALTLSPLPLMLLAGAELMAMPFLVERLKRRLEIEKKYAARDAHSMTQQQQYAALPPDLKNRFERLRALVARIQGNYKGLSVASQGIVAEQSEKFDVLLASCLRRFWLLFKYEEMGAAVHEGRIAAEIEEIQEAVQQGTLDPRVREAYQKNLQIKEELLRAARKNLANREALVADIDSLETLLQLLLQKSIAATDASAFSTEIDDVLSQVQADAASVEEMERLFGSFPDFEGRPKLALPQLKAAAPPPPPPPARQRQR